MLSRPIQCAGLPWLSQSRMAARSRSPSAPPAPRACRHAALDGVVHSQGRLRRRHHFQKPTRKMRQIIRTLTFSKSPGTKYVDALPGPPRRQEFHPYSRQGRSLVRHHLFGNQGAPRRNLWCWTRLLPGNRRWQSSRPHHPSRLKSAGGGRGGGGGRRGGAGAAPAPAGAPAAAAFRPYTVSLHARGSAANAHLTRHADRTDPRLDSISLHRWSRPSK